MRSTHLSVGSTYTSVQALKLAMHETYSPTYTWLVRRNEPAKGNASGRVNFQCPDASCSFALNARFGVDGATHITTSVPHDCRGAQRDRRRSIEELVSESPTLMGFVPNKQAKHGAEQLRRIADGAAVSLGVTQSHDYLRRISDKSVLDALAQYSYLESLTKQLKTSDPSGLYLFGAVAVDGAADQAKQIDHFFVSSSQMQHVLKNLKSKVICVDGTFPEGALKAGVYLLATARDANNSNVILAFGGYKGETADSYFHFVSQLLSGVDGPFHIKHDDQKGVGAALSRLPLRLKVSESLCALHMIEAFKRNNSLSNPEEASVWEMAYAGSKGDYNHAHGKLFDLNQVAADHFDELKERFATFKLLEAGIKTRGEVTSNSVEQANSQIRESRAAPIVRFVRELLNLTGERSQKSAACAAALVGQRQQLTTGAIDLFKAKMAATQVKKVVLKGPIRMFPHTLLQVVVQEATETTIKATVFVSPKGGRSYAIVLLQDPANSSVGTMSCSCGLPRDTGFPCGHIAKVFAYVVEQALTADGVWFIYDTKWWADCWHTATYIKQYDVLLPPLAVGELTLNLVVPFPIPAKKGKKSTKTPKPSKLKRTCKSCGEKGHFLKKCKHPNIVNIFNNYVASVKNYKME